MKQFISKFLNWIKKHFVFSVLIVALTTFAIFWVNTFITTISNNFLLSGQEAAYEIGDKYFPRISNNSPNVFRIVISPFDNDDNKIGTRTVIRAFRGENGLDVVQSYQSILVDGSGISSQTMLYKKGQDLLRFYHGDLLIFGEVDGKGEAANLQFMPANGPIQFYPHPFLIKYGNVKDDFNDVASKELETYALSLGSRPN